MLYTTVLGRMWSKFSVRFCVLNYTESYILQFWIQNQWRCMLTTGLRVIFPSWNGRELCVADWVEEARCRHSCWQSPRSPLYDLTPNNATRWLYCAKCPQYSIPLEEMFLAETFPSNQGGNQEYFFNHLKKFKDFPFIVQFKHSLNSSWVLCLFYDWPFFERKFIIFHLNSWLNFQRLFRLLRAYNSMARTIKSLSKCFLSTARLFSQIISLHQTMNTRGALYVFHLLR